MVAASLDADGGQVGALTLGRVLREEVTRHLLREEAVDALCRLRNLTQNHRVDP